MYITNLWNLRDFGNTYSEQNNNTLYYANSHCREKGPSQPSATGIKMQFSIKNQDSHLRHQASDNSQLSIKKKAFKPLTIFVF